MIIKVCGMKDYNNIGEALSLDIDMIGFIFYSGSKRYFGENRIPDTDKNINKVGVFVNQTEEEILETCKTYKLDTIQLHGSESTTLCKVLKNFGYNIIKAFSVCESFDFKEINKYRRYIDYALLDTKHVDFGGSGNKFDWSLLSKYNCNIPFILSGGIDISDIDIIKQIKIPQFIGIDLNSRFESNYGYKKIKKLKKFINLVKDE